LQTSNPKTLLIIVAPIVCLLIVGAAAYLQYSQMTALKADVATVQQQIVKINQTLRQTLAAPVIKRFAAGAPTKDEQAYFINWLRLRATAANVELARLSNIPPPAPPANAQASAPKDPNAPKPLPRGIAAQASTVEASGRYSDIRDFLYLLLKSERVLTINGVTWTRGEKWPQTKVSFTLTRYVYTEPKPTHGGAT
jgi:hypothetical protein